MSRSSFFGITSHPKFRQNTKCEPPKDLSFRDSHNRFPTIAMI